MLDQEFDKLLVETGGTGKTERRKLGRFQWSVLFAIFFVIDGVNFMYYNISYLELVPKEFFCIFTSSQVEVSCQPDDFCSNPELVSYRPNYDLNDSYYNWVEKLDLTCRPSGQIGLLGSMTFAGWIVTLTFVPRLSDLYGRKKIFFTSAIL